MSTNRKHDDGQLPDGWRSVRLGTFAEIRSGIGFPLERQGRQTGAYPFIKVSDMNLDGNEKFIRSANNYVDELDAAELGGSPMPEGTVIFPKIGAAIATNKKRILAAPTLIDNNMVGISLPDEATCNSRYLFYWFQTIDLSTLANVSTVPSITGSRLKQAPISLPPLPEQRAIADVLDSVDDAIERTEAVIAATETLRDSLLHELLTRGVPGWHTEWKDVPGIGTIPADWEVVRLGEVCEITPGFAMGPNRIPRNNPKPYLTVANVQANRVTIGERRFMEVTEDEYQSRTLRTGDVVVVEGHAQIAQLGRSAVVPPEADGFTYQNHLFRIRPSEQCKAAFVCAFVNGPAGRRYFGSFGGTTSGLNTVSATSVRALPIPLPDIDQQKLIAEMLETVDTAIEQADAQLDRLASLKGSIADALFTGKMRKSKLESVRSAP